jgi:hypothetical protein
MTDLDSDIEIRSKTRPEALTIGQKAIEIHYPKADSDDPL